MRGGRGGGVMVNGVRSTEFEELELAAAAGGSLCVCVCVCVCVCMLGLDKHNFENNRGIRRIIGRKISLDAYLCMHKNT